LCHDLAQALTGKNVDTMWRAVIAISIGSALGALLRWVLGLKFNSAFSAVPPGTLAANLIGGYIIGVAVAYFSQATQIAPEWRLFIITGFCGGLTTFSTFSAEVVALLEADRYPAALSAIAIHVSGSLIMTIAGLASWRWTASR
jgi:CrcB protein